MIERLERLLIETDYYEITIEELTVIDRLDSLKELFVKAVVEGRVSIKNIHVGSFRIDNYKKYTSKDNRRDFYYKVFAELLPKIGLIKEEFIDAVLENIDIKEYDLTDEDIKELVRSSNERTKDPNDIEEEYMHIDGRIDYNVYINMLLDYKRYDIIAKRVLTYKGLIDSIKIEDEVYQRVLDEFPIDEYGIPAFLVPYLIRIGSDLINLEIYSKLVCNWKLTLNTEDIYKLMEKASQEEIDNMPQMMDAINFKNEKHVELFNYILSKNQIFYIMEWKLKENPEILDKYLEVLTYRLKNNLPVHPNIIKECYGFIKENEEIKNIILNSKYILYLNQYQYDGKEIDLSNIDFDNDDIDLMHINMEALLNLPDEIFDKLIKKGNQSEALLISVYGTGPKYKERILKILNSGIEVHSLSLSKELIDREVLIELLNNKQLTTPRTISRVFTGRILERLLAETDLAIDFMEKYPDEFGGYFHYELDTIQKYPKILEYIYHNKFYMDVLLESLEMKSEDYYTDEIYEYAKGFLKEEYGIDTESLDRLKALAGPSVLKYVHNENIREFLALEAEDQQKIIALFPKTTYTSKDVHASFESIIQYSFSKNRIEDTEIFSRICHAISDGEETEINILKCRILGLITEEEFQKIKTSKGIKESSLDEYLTSLINDIKEGKDLEKTLIKLHEITNIYILNARQDYHSNHLYLNQGKSFRSREYLDFQNIIRMISSGEDISLENNYSDEEIVEIMNILKEKYNMAEYQNCPPGLFLITLVSHINASIKGNKNGNIENNIRILKYIIDYNNEKYKKEHPKTIEGMFDMPYQIEKKAMKGHLDKEIIGKARSYYLDDTSVYDLLAEQLESKGINKYILTLAIGYYTKGTEPPSTENVIKSINGILGELTITDPKTGKVIENCDVEYLLNHFDEISDYIIEDNFGFFTRKDTMGTYLISTDTKYTIVDIVSALKNNQINSDYIKGAIKTIIATYKKTIKDPNALRKSNNGLSPMQDFFDELINSYNRDVVVQKDNELIILYNYIKQELLKKGYDISEIEDLRQSYFICGDTDIPQIKKDYLEIMQTLYDEGALYFREGAGNELLQMIEASSSKKRYAVPQSDRNFASIIAELNIGMMKKAVLNDPKLYEELKEFIEIKKFHDTPEFISRTMEDLDLPIHLTPSTIAGFISYYSLIKKELEKENIDISDITFIEMVKKGEKYGEVSPVFKEILTAEDARLLKENPGHMAANNKVEHNGRLVESVKQTIKNYERKTVTVPPFDENVTVGEKEINIVVGNFTDHTNITHGERTDSCMRVGGVGEKLYYFALDNENGFHIRFEDPETHEYISRVTGFRNGNTVFLNQLRFSCSDKYESEDVVEACKQAAQMLIEKSKNSSCPIENVVITSGYAMSDYENDVIDLGIDSAQEGLPSFYSDINREGIVLATTAKEEQMQPINFDKSNVPTYKTQRGKIIKDRDPEKTKEKIRRIAAIKKITEGHPYDEIGEFEFDTGIIYGVASDDWYVYIDDEKNIVYDMINLDPRAKEEMEKCIAEMEELAKSKFIEMEAFDKNGGKNKNR